MKWKEVENKIHNTHRARKFFKRHIRKQFIAACGEEGTVHHIIPLALSLNNKWSNLIMLDNDFHQDIHNKIINPQIDSGEKTIFIPLEFNKELRRRIR